MTHVPALVALIDNAVTRWRKYRIDRRTRREIEGLPRNLRKDIGWPDPLPDRHARRFITGE